MRIVPSLVWTLASDPAEPLDPRLVPLLQAIAASGSLAAAVTRRGLSYRAAWGMLKDELAPRITGALFWKADAWAACLKVLAERPRRRKLQQVPPAAIDVLYHRDASQQESVPIAA